MVPGRKRFWKNSDPGSFTATVLIILSTKIENKEKDSEKEQV
jgi:hypothetical protein